MLQADQTKPKVFKGFAPDMPYPCRLHCAASMAHDGALALSRLQAGTVTKVTL